MEYKKKCVLEDKECINCHACEECDLFPGKICDNCGACLEEADYLELDIDEIDLGKSNN